MAFLPLNAATACIRRSRRFLVLADQQLPVRKIKNDLRRTALTMSVAAVDTYMHWLVFRRISDIRREGDLPKSLAKFDVPFADLASLADSLIEAQREKRSIRPWVQVKNTIQKRLLRETLQSYEQVSLAFSLAGIEKGWTRVAEKLGSSQNDLKARLNHLVHRRNQIVHEGDITRASRPRKLKYNAIDHTAILAEVNWLEQLLESIDAVIEEGNPP